MRVDRDKLIWPLYELVGLFENTGLEDVLRAYIDAGKATTWDGALIDFHFASLHEVIPEINQDAGKLFTFDDAWQGDTAERMRTCLRQFHQQHPPTPASFQIQLDIADQFIYQPISQPVIEKLGLPVALALEVMLLRAYECLKSTNILMQHPLIEHRVTLAMAQEALILWKKFWNEPATVLDFERLSHFGRLKDDEATKQWQEKTFRTVDPDLLGTIDKTKKVLQDLNCDPDDPGTRRRIRALNPGFPWQKMVILDEHEKETFGIRPAYRYKDVFGDRNIVAHSLPRCWDSYVRIEQGELKRVCGPTDEPSPPHYMAMFIWSDFFEALRAMRETLETDYALWHHILYAPTLEVNT